MFKFKMLRPFFTTLVFGTILACLGSCTPSSPSSDTTSPTPTPSNSTPQVQVTPTNQPLPSPTATASATTQPKAATASVPPEPAKTPASKVAKEPVSVTIFLADDQCQKMVPKEVKVSAESPVAGAVTEVVGQVKIKDLDLEKPEIAVDFSKQTAAIDLRLSANSKRNFDSLSSCEKFVLFDSLRSTLTKNTKWSIKTVKFTNQGKTIEL
jgi:hypothetical protein